MITGICLLRLRVYLNNVIKKGNSISLSFLLLCILIYRYKYKDSTQMHTYVKFTLTQIQRGLFRLRRSYLSSYPWFALQTTGVRIIKPLFTEPSRLAVRQYFCRNCVTLNLTMGFRNSGNFRLRCAERRLCLYKLIEDIYDNLGKCVSTF